MPSIDAHYSEALGLQAEIHFASGNFTAGVEECSNAFKLNKANLAAKYLRGKSYEKLGDLKNATDLRELSKTGYKNSEALPKKLLQVK